MKMMMMIIKDLNMQTYENCFVYIALVALFWEWGHYSPEHNCYRSNLPLGGGCCSYQQGPSWQPAPLVISE